MRRQLGRGQRLRWAVRRARPVLRQPMVALRHRGLIANDVFLAGYPKAGNT
ncbi:MAG TPA: hypothetical protein VEM93_02995 [Actinomycetota bacterium]|nr:hypothetical protein [Actinomycetota bacterium]